MAGLLDFISAFTTLPGPRKRAEVGQQMRLDEIDRMTSANIAQQKAATEEALLQDRLMRQQKWEAQQEGLFRHYLSQGMSQQEAVAKANADVAAMKSVPGLEDLSTAQQGLSQLQGRAPLEKRIGELAGQAEATGLEATRTSNLADASTAQARLQEGPTTELKRLRAVGKGFDLSGRQSDAMAPLVGDLTTQTTLADTSAAQNRRMQTDLQRQGLPALVEQEGRTALATAKANETMANQEAATLPDPTLAKSAGEAKLRTGITLGNQAGTAQLLEALRGLDPYLLEALKENPALLQQATKGLAAPNPITPSGLPDRGISGQLRPRGNIRTP